MDAHGGAKTMIFWMAKLLNSLRRAIEGRKHPHQLAWAVALGLLLGVVPHGNLLAFALVHLRQFLKYDTCTQCI